MLRDKIERDGEFMEKKSSLKAFFATKTGRIVLTVLCAVVIWGCIALLASNAGPLTIIPLAICTYFGWNVLNRIQPSMFLWMSWIGWIFYFVIKFVLAVAIGAFVAPIVLGKQLAEKIGESQNV